jgi:hypothetical protein
VSAYKGQFLSFVSKDGERFSEDFKVLGYRSGKRLQLRGELLAITKFWRCLV